MDERLAAGLRGIPDEGVFTPESVSWRVHADPAMGLAGLRALMLQALHPLAMAGVAEHSAYREDPWGRLYRTAFFIGAVTYGTGDEAREVLERVHRVHRRVRGTDPATGRPYRADDPDLLVWVHCSEVASFLDVVRRAGLRLTDGEADAYLREQAAVARLVGVPPHHPVPESTASLDGYFRQVRPELLATPAARAALRFAFVPPFPALARWATPVRPAWCGLAALAFALLPGWARRMYGLPGWTVTDLAATAEARVVRAGLLRLPGGLREGPHLVAARRRWAAVAR
ncbi:oxygenase MpaB family protein [Kitasatospora sp. NPDC050543]|uniref:oxygenase MpaB family protein n=1 Tax=Kitasatospora sp. NPDC050543 TaxID=3364054 RepID=UPI0037ADB70E